MSRKSTLNTELTELTVKQLRWIVNQANGDATLAEAIEDCADAERREVEARAPQRPPAAVLRRMKRHAVLLGVAAVAALTVVGSVLAVSNAHFVGTPTASRSGNTLTVSGKVAGLGDVEVITVTISADAACVNPGSMQRSFPGTL